MSTALAARQDCAQEQGIELGQTGKDASLPPLCDVPPSACHTTRSWDVARKEGGKNPAAAGLYDEPDVEADLASALQAASLGFQSAGGAAQQPLTGVPQRPSVILCHQLIHCIPQFGPQHWVCRS